MNKDIKHKLSLHRMPSMRTPGSPHLYASSTTGMHEGRRMGNIASCIRVVFPFTIFMIILNLTACVSVFSPGKAYYDAKISSIEICIMCYEKIKHKDEVDRFELLVTENLRNKGYQVILGPKLDCADQFPSSAAKNVIPNSTADAIMLVQFFANKLPMFIDEQYIAESLWHLNAYYWMYSRNGEKVLQSQFTGDGEPYSHIRKSERIRFANTKALLTDILHPIDPNLGSMRPLETEEEYRLRVVNRITSNIPSYVSVPIVNASEPWTGKWTVKGVGSSRTVWIFKQNNRTVTLTDQDRVRAIGTVSGDKLEGTYEILQRDFAFRFQLSPDAMAFQGFGADQYGINMVSGTRVE